MDKPRFEIAGSKYVLLEHMVWAIKGMGMDWTVSHEGRYPWLALGFVPAKEHVQSKQGQHAVKYGG